MRGRRVAIVFSSTTATYGAPNRIPITEDEPQRPINPYGFTQAGDRTGDGRLLRGLRLGLCRVAILQRRRRQPRTADLGEDHDRETHLIPMVLQVALGSAQVTIFGDDYPTPTAPAFATTSTSTIWPRPTWPALDHLQPGKGLALNLGTGRGYSVRASDRCLPPRHRAQISHRIGPRRPGDPPELVADASWPSAHARLGPRISRHRLDRRHGLALARVASARIR